VSTLRARPGRRPRISGAVPPAIQPEPRTPPGQRRTFCALRPGCSGIRRCTERRTLPTGLPVHRTAGSRGARTRATGCGSSPNGVRAADAARTDFPAGLTLPGQASPTTTHRAEHPESGPQRTARDRPQASPRSVSRGCRGVASRPDFCHLIMARLDDKLMTNDLQASSKIWKLACELRELVGGTRLELVTSSVSGKRSPN
jgi:hypothetical protein